MGTQPQIVPGGAPVCASPAHGACRKDPQLKRAGALPIRISFVVGSFTFGGSETETIELVLGADRRTLQFLAVAVLRPLPLPDGEPPRDGRFPPIYLCGSQHSYADDPRVRVVEDFSAAVRRAISDVDVVITWGIHNLQDYLPTGRLPRFVIMSKDSAEWARRYLHANSFLTRHHVGNSTLAASAFPDSVRGGVQVIHNGINPRRVAVKVGRSAQRRAWGLGDDDKVVGYLGRIERDKGLGKTVRGVALLPPEWKVVFIGINPNCGYGHELAADCEQLVPGRYRLLPWCHDIGSALAAMDVFAHPSEHEGFSNSIGEAWLAGVPTVYTEHTGAIPDLGDLGVPVAADVGAAEMARAILRAHGDRSLAARARHVIMNNYLVQHNVERWTDYLKSLHDLPRKFRVLITAPDPQLGREAAELCSLLQPDNGLDFCRLVAIGNEPPAKLDLVRQLAADCHCPFTHLAPTAMELRKIVHLVRPDVILCLGPPAFDQFVREGNAIPVIHMPSASAVVDAEGNDALRNLVNNHVQY